MLAAVIRRERYGQPTMPFGLSIAKQRPDLILMDIQLPIVDGYTATRQIKSDPALIDPDHRSHLLCTQWGGEEGASRRLRRVCAQAL